jgi:hypothetical protein
MIPYLGNADVFGNPLSTAIIGVKVHGSATTLYRTFETVKIGANLTTYCILSELERWRLMYDKYPDELYIQLDGGSENANTTVLGILELLTIQRVCRKILYTRLPVGHTHEDVDAVFSVVWKSIHLVTKNA